MTFVVPFDGSKLAEAALVRATEYGDVLDEDVVAVTRTGGERLTTTPRDVVAI